jgi:hypothetical protein
MKTNERIRMFVNNDKISRIESEMVIKIGKGVYSERSAKEAEEAYEYAEGIIAEEELEQFKDEYRLNYREKELLDKIFGGALSEELKDVDKVLNWLHDKCGIRYRIVELSNRVVEHTDSIVVICCVYAHLHGFGEEYQTPTYDSMSVLKHYIVQYYLNKIYSFLYAESSNY